MSPSAARRHEHGPFALLERQRHAGIVPQVGSYPLRVRVSQCAPGPIHHDDGSRQVADGGRHPHRQPATVGADHAVGQRILHGAGGQVRQRQVAPGDEIPHLLLVGVDAGEGQGDDDERERQHRPQEQLGLQAAQPAVHGEPPEGRPLLPARCHSERSDSESQGVVPTR